MHTVILNLIDGKVATVEIDSDAPREEVAVAVAEQVVNGDVVDAGEFNINMAHVVSFKVR